MIILNNGKIRCEISEMGAEIKRIVKNGTEYMWDSDPKFWAQSAPIMFPICGGLKGGKYTIDGKEYQLSKHGFAKLNRFDVENATDESAVLVLHDNEETRKAYPFGFEFKVTFRLVDTALEVTYSAINKGDKTMYCSFGAHEAYATPEGIEAYDVIFPEKETLYAYALNGDLLTDYTKLIIEDSCVLPLKEEYFYLDALVFRGLKSRSAILRNRENGREVKVEFPGFDYFLLWHKYTAPYICIEPWTSVPSYDGIVDDMETKYQMTTLAPNENYSIGFDIIIG